MSKRRSRCIKSALRRKRLDRPKKPRIKNMLRKSKERSSRRSIWTKLPNTSSGNGIGSRSKEKHWLKRERERRVRVERKRRSDIKIL